MMNLQCSAMGRGSWKLEVLAPNAKGKLDLQKKAQKNAGDKPN